MDQCVEKVVEEYDVKTPSIGSRAQRSILGMCFFFAAVDGLALRVDILQYYGLVQVLPYPFFRMIRIFWQ